MITFNQFTTDFPEFGNGVATQGQFNLYANLASIMLPQDRWGAPGPDVSGNATQYDFGAELFIAHNLALGIQAAKQGAGGGAPGSESRRCFVRGRRTPEPQLRHERRA
jgi:hypothetical protein